MQIIKRSRSSIDLDTRVLSSDLIQISDGSMFWYEFWCWCSSLASPYLQCQTLTTNSILYQVNSGTRPYLWKPWQWFNLSISYIIKKQYKSSRDFLFSLVDLKNINMEYFLVKIFKFFKNLQKLFKQFLVLTQTNYNFHRFKHFSQNYFISK